MITNLPSGEPAASGPQVTAGERAAARVMDPEREALLLEQWKPALRSGFLGWISAVNHKQIGKRYIFTGFAFFALAGIAALLMRIQLMYPENTFLNADQYDRLFSVHGITMMFVFAVPIMLGVGLYFVPLLIGTRDVAFPKANAFGSRGVRWWAIRCS